MQTALRLAAITVLVGWLPVLAAYGAIQMLLRAPDWLTWAGACLAYFAALFAGAMAASHLDR